MANKKMFASASASAKATPVTNTVNAAGGSAYKMSVKHALAQYAVTGTFADGFYTKGTDQLENFIDLLKKTDPIFAAKLAVYARQKGLMKDTPAAILAWLASTDVEVMKKAFGKVVNNSKMLRNFVQMVRSGKFGRKSFGNAAKRAIQKWIDARTNEQLFNDAIGNDPSLADIIKMVHVKPKDKSREALYGYILGKDVPASKLPKFVKDFEDFKAGKTQVVPDVSWQRLTALPLSEKNWKELAEKATWTTTRMNLNTFERHGVFKESALVKKIASKLSSKEEIARAKVFPYQIMMAFLSTDGTGVPSEIRNALQEAMEVAVENVPSLNGKNVKIAVDTSGSMGSAVTGNRGSVTSKARCIDVASLIASSLLRKNKGAKLYPFDTSVHSAHSINAFDSVMTNADKLRKFGGGGTDCGCAMNAILKDAKSGDVADVVVFISDNESWYNDNGFGRATEVAQAWSQLCKINPKAKMICIDLIGNDTIQIVDGKNVMNVGGFSDAIFDEINRFVCEFSTDTWVQEIEKIEI